MEERKSETYIGINEVARRLGVSRTTAYQLVVTNGRIPSWRIGEKGKHRVPEQAVEKYLEEQLG